jgi:hypothetical protein
MGLGQSNWEYRLIEVGNWELARLHKVLSELEGQGWQLDAVYDSQEAATAAETAVHMWLRRPAHPGHIRASA